MSSDRPRPLIERDDLERAVGHARDASTEMLLEAADRLEDVERRLEVALGDAVVRFETALDRAVDTTAAAVRGPVHDSLSSLKVALTATGVALVALGTLGLVAPDAMAALLPYLLAGLTAAAGIGCLALALGLDRAQHRTGRIARQVESWREDLPRESWRAAAAGVRLARTARRLGRKGKEEDPDRREDMHADERPPT